MTTTPAIDTAELAAQLGATPPEVRSKLAALFADRGWPKLSTPDAWTPEQLYAAACELSNAAKAAGYEGFRIPLNLAGLTARIAALPVDLSDQAALVAVPQGVPNVAHVSRWTPEHWLIVDPILEHAEEQARKRLTRLVAALDKVPNMTDDLRHSLAGEVTAGRTTSGKQLTGPEARYLAEWAERASLGQTSAGPGPFAVDWKAEAKRLGTTQADLLKDVKAWFKERRLAAPAKVSEVTDPRAVAYLLRDRSTAPTIATDATEQPASAPTPAAPAPSAPEEPTPAPSDPGAASPNTTGPVAIDTPAAPEEPTPLPVADEDAMGPHGDDALEHATPPAEDAAAVVITGEPGALVVDSVTIPANVVAIIRRGGLLVELTPAVEAAIAIGAAIGDLLKLAPRS